MAECVPEAASQGSADESWPAWVTWLRAALMVSILLGLAVGVDVPARGTAIGLTVLAISPWLLEAAGVRLHTSWFAAIALVPVAVMNVADGSLDLTDEHESIQFTLIIAVFLVGEAVSAYPARHATLVVAAVALLTVVRAPHGPIWTLAVAVAGTCGLLLRSVARALQDLQAVQETLAAEAARDERRRIAREVHDVIAHSLTVAMLHITAARLAVGRGDDAAATEALEEAEQAGRASLAEVRRTVGLLREDSAVEPPAPAAHDLGELVEGWRAAGLQVTLDIDGDLSRVPAQVGLALYRITQESLANVARHSPTAVATVTVSTREPVHLAVRSSGGPPVASSGRGAGLVGMRERAEALGGSCRAGPEGDSWVVEAVLPSPQSELSS